MGIEIKCSLTERCGHVTTFAEGIPCHLRCMKCDNTLVSHSEEKNIIIKCTKCLSYIEIEPEREFSTICQCGGRFWIINPKIAGREVEVKSIPEEESKEEPTEETVTAIVVCYNELSITKECINRLRETACDKIVLVDNASTDGTKEWGEKQDDILYIRNQMNLGCGIARNQGAKHAHTEYVLFLDNDQYVPPDIIGKFLSIEKADLIGVESRYVSEGGTTHTAGEQDIARGYVGAGGLFLKRRVFLELGGFDERYAPLWYEDVDFSFRARVNGLKIVRLNNHGVLHLGHKTIASQKDFDEEKIKNVSKRIFLELWKHYLQFGKVKEDKEEELQERPKLKRRTLPTKPKIYILVDVPNWAWDIKTRQITKYLADEFDFVVEYFSDVRGKPVQDCDLYFTYECNFVNRLFGVPEEKIITGVTAHTYTNFSGFDEDLKRVGAIHANSKMLFGEIKEYNENCFYLPNGVDENLFEYNTRNIEREFTACFVGKDNKYKGLREIIRPACKKAGVKLKELSGTVKNPDRIDHENMPEFYRDVDVVLIASKMDGTPNPLLEAASVGRTFIANSIGNVPEFYNGDNGFIVDLKVAEYVEKLKWLKANRVACGKMGYESRTEVERNWTWATQAENYRRMFRELLK